MAAEKQSSCTPSTSTHISSHALATVDELINKYSFITANVSVSRYSRMAKKSRNVLQRLVDRVRLKYYPYEVTFGPYVMTRGEKLAANSFVAVGLSLLLWALLLYFPTLFYRKLTGLVWLLTGYSSEEIGTALGILETHVISMSTLFSAESAP